MICKHFRIMIIKLSNPIADIIVADALYCKSTWIKEVLSIGMDVVVRVKDALCLFNIMKIKYKLKKDGL